MGKFTNISYEVDYPVQGAKFLNDSTLLITGGDNQASNKRLTALTIDLKKQKKPIKKFRELKLSDENAAPTTLDANNNLILLGCNESFQRVQEEKQNHNVQKFQYQNEHLKYIASTSLESPLSGALQYQKFIRVGPDASIAVVASSKLPTVIHILDPTKLIVKYEIETNNNVEDLDLSPDGKMLAYITGHSLELISIVTGRSLQRRTDFKDWTLSKVKFEGNNHILLASVLSNNCGIQLSKLGIDYKLKIQKEALISNQPNDITSIDVNHANGVIALATTNNSLIFLKIQSLKQIKAFNNLHKDRITRITFSPNGNLLASVSIGNSVNITTVPSKVGIETHRIYYFFLRLFQLLILAFFVFIGWLFYQSKNNNSKIELSDYFTMKPRLLTPTGDYSSTTPTNTILSNTVTSTDYDIDYADLEKTTKSTLRPTLELKNTETVLEEASTLTPSVLEPSTTASSKKATVLTQPAEPSSLTEEPESKTLSSSKLKTKKKKTKRSKKSKKAKKTSSIISSTESEAEVEAEVKPTTTSSSIEENPTSISKSISEDLIKSSTDEDTSRTSETKSSSRLTKLLKPTETSVEDATKVSTKKSSSTTAQISSLESSIESSSESSTDSEVEKTSLETSIETSSTPSLRLKKTKVLSRIKRPTTTTSTEEIIDSQATDSITDEKDEKSVTQQEKRDIEELKESKEETSEELEQEESSDESEESNEEGESETELEVEQEQEPEEDSETETEAELSEEATGTESEESSTEEEDNNESQAIEEKEEEATEFEPETISSVFKSKLRKTLLFVDSSSATKSTSESTTESTTAPIDTESIETDESNDNDNEQDNEEESEEESEEDGEEENEESDDAEESEELEEDSLESVIRSKRIPGSFMKEPESNDAKDEIESKSESAIESTSGESLDDLVLEDAFSYVTDYESFEPKVSTSSETSITSTVTEASETNATTQTEEETEIKVEAKDDTETESETDTASETDGESETEFVSEVTENVSEDATTTSILTTSKTTSKLETTKIATELSESEEYGEDSEDDEDSGDELDSGDEADSEFSDSESSESEDSTETVTSGFIKETTTTSTVLEPKLTVDDFVSSKTDGEIAAAEKLESILKKLEDDQAETSTESTIELTTESSKVKTTTESTTDLEASETDSQTDADVEEDDETESESETEVESSTEVEEEDPQKSDALRDEL